MLITVAIPCYKSAKTLPFVVDGIRAEFRSHPDYDYQIVLVNDGSGDRTFDVISELCKKDSGIVGIDLSKNYGQASAKMAAIPYVKGEILIYMDDDGQHDSSGIFSLVHAIEDGADVAIADFQQKKHTAFKRVTSYLNTEMLRIFIDKPKEIHTSSFSAYNSFMIRHLRNYNSPFISMFSYVLQFTRRIVNVPVPHHERIEGTSGYTLKKLFRLWSDGIFSFSMVSLRWFFAAASFFLLVGVLCLIGGIVAACLDVSPVLLVLLGVMLLLTGFVFVGFGVIGEYLGRISLASNGIPQYAVRSVLNDNENGSL